MKRISILLILPFFLFALERVNLIKDHSFEKDSEVWHTRVWGDSYPSVANVDRHDPQKSIEGNYAGSGDTRAEPPDPILSHEEFAYISQGLCCRKKLEDIDSFKVQYSVFPVDLDLYKTYFTVMLIAINSFEPDYKRVGYGLKQPELPFSPPEPYKMKMLKNYHFPEDTHWFSLDNNIRSDIYGMQLFPPDALVDSVIFWIAGGQDWWGQKIYFDDVCLMGYADYDVGVKEIIPYNGDGFSYIPSAIIKNYGRQPTESFQAIATLIHGDITDTIYADTLTWSLDADTEEEISFATFYLGGMQKYLPGLLACTLFVRTIMEPDECDEDDVKTLFVGLGAVTEPPVTPVTHPSVFDLRVNPLSANDVHVSYNIAQGYIGILSLFDASGRRVDAKQVRGYGSATFNTVLPAGVYIVKLEVAGSALSRKVVVVE